MKTMSLKNVAAMGAGALVLVACGGGDDLPPPPPPPPPVISGTDVPVSATQSAGGAFDFVASVAANQDDTAEPLVVGAATLGSSDTEEARALR